MASPDNPFGWFDANQGYVLAPPTVAPSGTISSSNGTITGLGTVTVIQGQLVQAGSLTLPSFTNAAFTNSGSIVINKNGTGNISGQTVTVQNWPALIGGEWSATIAAGGTLASSYWNGTGVTRIQDVAPNSSPLPTAPTPTPGAARLGDIFLIMGGTVTPSLGSTVSGWFLKAIGDGATFESDIATAGTAVAAISRAPDFVIPLDNAAYAAGNIRFANGDVELPPGPFKTVIQNTSTTSLPAGSAVILLPKDFGY